MTPGELWRPAPKRAYKPRDPAITSAMMSAVRATGNKAETLLRRELWRRGLRYRLYHRGLVGRPDIVFTRARVVVFVDGDYWHGRAILQDGEAAFAATMRTPRRDWWIAKLRRNIDRDAEVTRRLEAEGWRVIRVWESEVGGDLTQIARRIERVVKTRAARATSAPSARPPRPIRAR